MGTARRQGAYRLEVQYKFDLGYPVRIAIDYDRQAVDDEFGFTATDFRPLVTLQGAS